MNEKQADPAVEKKPMTRVEEIVNARKFTRTNIITLLRSEGADMQFLINEALQEKLSRIGNEIHLRGLIEYSNVCRKNCLYCGLRRDSKQHPYVLSDEDVLKCAQLAVAYHYGSVAIQCGERTDREFTDKIESLVRQIKKLSNGKLGITLSCGEQTREVYARWREAGAHRYLLRIETSNRELYYRIHPNDPQHSFEQRLACLDYLKELDYQTGTGVMVGLPTQSVEHLADDILYFQAQDFAMIGLGPYIPHPQTPLWEKREMIPSPEARLHLTLKVLAVTRLMMSEINMVAATAMQTLDPLGREKAVVAGANVIMPNLTPTEYREGYFIYPDKACVKDKPEDCDSCLDARMRMIGHKILYNSWGDSKAYLKKIGLKE